MQQAQAVRRSATAEAAASTTESSAASLASTAQVGSAVDSGIGSSSEYDQDNSGHHLLHAQDDTSDASTDEGYADSDASSFLSSILSEVRRGVEIEGRLYPSYGKHDYGMPIDEKELDRNDLQHHKYSLLLKDRLFVAPISEEQLNTGNSRILDLGTGTGIWAIDMADKFPHAEIIGVDIAATQPSFVPPNCVFEIDDVEEDWPYRQAHFDFVHGRDLMTAVRDWPRLISQAYTHLKPGGWIQLASTIPGALTDDDTIPPNSGYVEAGRLYYEVAQKMGAPLDAPRGWAEQMRSAGFSNVQDEVYKLPMGPWPRSKRLRTVGKLEQIMILDGGFEAYLLRGYTQVLGGRAEDLQIILALAKREVRDPNVHTYVHFHITYGQKPL
ncbi:S-adenosyl-L-methionine-dependent methyltransferase [Cucurbitaria berberidis CBS 394.84]|uniref:S-adenosyl-L-methionine-dependent methyltransferase n=1 Tax=Cucurbitaria berberidis CBS 394.84 TaxID=1168544 RepID=A0A9P4GB54_9PLEO|nr:S-adenosyl-L-methionine-dependent methyltransferase [Cucurbitaria berberidis CBS 394.84]KAF1842294.1 S-adenosyl-L-methionine-dependent methyltransferase [Cucurbitaria berberidis CBS 394.84]